jgi:hypothetical protein
MLEEVSFGDSGKDRGLGVASGQWDDEIIR